MMTQEKVILSVVTGAVLWCLAAAKGSDQVAAPRPQQSDGCVISRDTTPPEDRR